MKKNKYTFIRGAWEFDLIDVSVLLINDGNPRCFVTGFITDNESGTNIALKEEIPVYLALEQINVVVDYLALNVFVDAKLIDVTSYYDYNNIKLIKMVRENQEVIIDDPVEVFELVDLLKYNKVLEILKESQQTDDHTQYLIEFVFENNSQYKFYLSQKQSGEINKIIEIIDEYL